MARHNLKLNYSELEKLATSCLELGSSLDEIKSTVKNMEKTIANCKGQAASSITGDGDEIVESIDKFLPSPHIQTAKQKQQHKS